MDVVQAEDLMALGVVWIASATVPVDIGAVPMEWQTRTVAPLFKKPLYRVVRVCPDFLHPRQFLQLFWENSEDRLHQVGHV